MRDFIPVAKAAQLLKCSRSSILRYLECGELEGFRYTGRGWWRINRASVEKKLRECAKCVTDYRDSGV